MSKSAYTFLTALAPDAQVQGSRDPLGLLPIWARLGRGLISNVTTVSGDLRGWTTLLTIMGLFRDRVDAGVIDIADTETLFRAEQLIGYSRYLQGQSGSEVRGLNQIKVKLRAHDQGKQPIRLGTSRERRILVSQRATGVWGQISSPASSSLLVDRPRMALAPAALPLWTQLIRPRLEPVSQQITAILLDKRGFEPARGDQKMAKLLAALHDPQLDPAEVVLYRDHILYGGRGTDRHQAVFVELWRKQGADILRGGVDLPRIAALAQRAREAGHPEVAVNLEHIGSAESLLAPLERLFSWMLGRNRQTLDDVVSQLKASWNEPITMAARASDEVIGPPVREVYGREGTAVLQAFGGLRQALIQGVWRDVVLGLVDLNTMTMKRRGGAAWVQVVNGKLDVRFDDEQSPICSLAELHRDLVHSYYLDPLRRLIVAWEDGQHA